MHTKLQNLRLLDGRRILAIFAVVLLLCAIFIGLKLTQSARAANLSTINFQARLMNDTGSIAQDGNYNVEFKLYSAATPDGGETPDQGACTVNSGSADEDCVWVESRTGGNTVTVVNGYVTVNLGSVSSFASTINWNTDLWLTMRVGGTGTPSWDTEMSPRLKLTAVPYAFKAASLALQTGANTSTLSFDTQTGAHQILLPDDGGVVCLQDSVDCGFVAGAATDFIQNQIASQQATSDFWISGTGRADTSIQAPLFDTGSAVALAIGTTNATAINLNQNTTIAANKTLTVTSGLTSLTGDTTGDALNVSNSTSTGNIAVFKDNSTTVLTIADGGAIVARNSTDGANAFRIQNQAGDELMGVDSTNSILRLLNNNNATIATGGWTTNSNNLPAGRFKHGSATYNGYVYVVGGNDNSDVAQEEVYYAKLNANGSIGTWASTTALPQVREELTAVAVNGYLYAIGGRGASNVVQDSVYYAKINSDGTVGTWNSTTVLPTERSSHTTVTANGYVYLMGGDETGGTVDKVHYARLNSDGTLGAWSSTNTFGTALRYHSSVAANGYVYALAGNDGATDFTAVRKAKINTDGTLGSWSTTTALPNTRIHGAAGILNGYIYHLGGDGSTGDYGDVFFAPLNADGTIGSWTQTTDMNVTRRGATVVTSNGYLYAIGGENGSAILTQEYASPARVTIAGALDLVSLAGENLAEGGSGGNLTAGDTHIAGLLTVTDSASFKGGATVGNNLTVQSQNNSTSAFAVLNASGVPQFSVDSANSRVYIGNPVEDTVGAVLVLDSMDDSSDPTGVAGGIYYNSDSGKFRCHEGGAWKDCIGASSLTSFTQGGNDFNADAVLGTTDADDLVIITQNVTRATFDNSNGLYLGNGVTAAAPNDFTLSGTGSSTTAVDGGTLTVQGGDATVGNANGGDLLLSGGAGFGTGTRGLVVFDTPTVSATTTDANCGATTAVDCTISLTTVNNTGSVVTGATAVDVTITMPDPTNTTAGRIFYFTASASSTNDFELELNAGGTLIEVAMKANSTATLVWNGTDWTVGGASSSTTLQAAYDNTLSSAGGAEIILNNTATSNGLTVRNNDTSPIIGGGLLEVQTSIGTNLFSVNNNISELVANGGGEDNSAFTTDWTALGTSSVTRTTTTNQYATGAAGVSVAAGTTAGNGIRNNLVSNPATGTMYMISFTARLASGSPAFTDLRVDYTPTGGTTGTQCIASQTLVSTGWTRITCEIDTPGTTVTNPDILIYQVAGPGSARTFYIDNLSMTLADDDGGIPNNVQIGGGIYGGAPTLFTLDRSSAPPVANNNETYLGSMYYDTGSGRIQCYEADGWGACGSAPNNIVVLTPEYAGAVLNGTGIGTLSADFCANSAALSVGSLCSSGVSRNFYEWTSPQSSMQTYSIYVSYKLPNTFKAFDSANTITLTWLTTSASGTDGYVSYQVFRSTGSAITSCDGSTESTQSSPSANTWYTTPFNGDETACGFVGGDNIIFKINVKARSNENVYVENLNFTYGNS